MAAYRQSSPFPTSHDTVGLSTFNNSAFSSSPKSSHIRRNSNLKSNLKSKRTIPAQNLPPITKQSSKLPRRQSISPVKKDDDSDSEANLSDFTFDLNKLPGQITGIGEDEPILDKDADKSDESDDNFDFGGPDDFTLNIVDHIKAQGNEGVVSSIEDSPKQSQGGDGNGDNGKNNNNEEEDEDEDDEDEDEDEEDKEYAAVRSTRIHECTELEPPLETSTPAHLLWRKDKLSKDQHIQNKEYSHIDGANQDSFANDNQTVTPGRPTPPPHAVVGNDDDDNIATTYGQHTPYVTSAAQKIQELQTQLEEQTVYTNSVETQLAEKNATFLRFKELQLQLNERDRTIQLNQTKLENFHSLEQEVNRLRKEMAQAVKGYERTPLRQRLNDKDEQLRKIELKLHDTSVSYQLRTEQMTAEIQRMKLKHDEQAREIDRLNNHSDTFYEERRTLEHNVADLSKNIENLKLQIVNLQANLAVASSESGSRHNAIKDLAEKLSLPAAGKEFTEVITLLESHFDTLNQPPAENIEGPSQVENELQEQLQESTSLTRILTVQLDSTREELLEVRSTLSALKTEKAQISSRLDRLTTDHLAAQKRALEYTKERDQALNALNALREENKDRRQQQNLGRQETDKLEKSHRIEIERIKSTHAEEMSKLRSEQSSSASDLDTLLKTAQERETQLNAELTVLRETTADQEVEMERHTKECAQLKSVIEAKESTAAELDSKFASALKKREQVWESRINKLLQERDRMSKALLWTWGKVEVGATIVPPDDAKAHDKKAKERGHGETQGLRVELTMAPLPLEGVKVVELAGLAPGPFAGLLLADYGASVLRVDRAHPNAHSKTLPLPEQTPDFLARNKTSIALDLKSTASKSLLLDIISKADVLIDPFRPGVLERLGLCPTNVLLKRNPRLIVARMTGFRRDGKYKDMAGHDINYIAVSGVLSMLGRAGEAPYAPGNILGDFAGGGAVCFQGILLALLSRATTGRGQIVNANMVDGAAYLATMPRLVTKTPRWSGPRGTNMLDGGCPFYNTYETKDKGKYFSVGAIEPQFYAELLRGLGLVESQTLPPGATTGREDKGNWAYMTSIIASQFKKKTRKEWEAIFDGTDACATPVLTLEELEQNNFDLRPIVELSETPGLQYASNEGGWSGGGLRPSQGGEETLAKWYGWQRGKNYDVQNGALVTVPSGKL
ncbi:hypothetical protein FQN57_002931 [Myotisia sp. PD_48]|nr:hypothetical protein FQN57_002931 [Myotisia sp. PD_48]